MPWTTAVAVLSGLVSLGCQCGADAPASTGERSPVASEGTPEPSGGSAEPPAEEAPPPAPRLDPARAAEVRAAIREGRVASRSERWDDALAAFDRALRILPGAPRVRCEAGYVAHRAGRERRAARDLDLALALLPSAERASVPAELRVPLAMCLYNRGLVHEALDEHWRAARRYEDSLALRPHPAVEARLAAVEEREQRRLVGLGPEKTADEVLEAIDAVPCSEVECDGDDEDEADIEQPDDCSIAEPITPTDEGSLPEGVGAFTTTTEECSIEHRTVMVAVLARGGWALFEIGNGETSTTDSFYSHEVSHDFELTATRVGDDLVRFDLESSESSRYGDDVSPPEGLAPEDDPHCMESHYDTHTLHHVILCRTDGLLARCGRLLLGWRLHSTDDVYCARASEPPAWARADGDEEAEDEDAEEPDQLTLTFEAGVAVIRAREGITLVPEGPDPGRYDLDALFARVLREVPEYTQ